MNELRKAAEVALEALDGVLDTYGEPLDLLTISGGAYEALECRDAITALRAALAQSERKPPKHKSAIATVFYEKDGRQQIEFITQVPVGELVRLYADPPLYHMDLMNVAVAVRDACHHAWATSTQNWPADIDLTEIVIDAANRQPIDDKVLWEMWVESPSDVLRFARAIEKAHEIE